MNIIGNTEKTDSVKLRYFGTFRKYNNMLNSKEDNTDIENKDLVIRWKEHTEDLYPYDIRKYRK